MHVNRSRFLLLTAALAGGAGCTINNTNLPADGGTQDGSTGGDASSGDSSTGDSSTGDSSTGDGGTAPDCNALGDAGAGDGGTSCASNAAFGAACTAFGANLKPRVAKRAVDCAVALPSCESGAGLDTCLSSALAQACSDTTAATTCAAIASICGDAGADAGISATQCQQLLSGMTPTARAAIQTCFTEGACATDLAGCIANTIQ
jgi:hypothetical protein